MIRFQFVLVLVAICFCASINICTAQKKIDTKKVIAIRNQLNNMEIDKALNNIEKLLKEEPYVPYYNELKVQVLQQIIEHIIEAKGETEETQSLGYLNETNQFVKDTFDWSNEADTAMLSFEDDKNNLEENDEQAKQEVNKVQIEKNGKESKVTKSTTFDAMDAVKEDKGFYIDSTLLQDDFEYKEPANTQTENELDKPIVAPEEALPGGFTKSKSKQQKLIEKYQLMQQQYADMDLKYYKNSLIDAARLSTLYIEYADSASKYLKYYVIDTAESNRKYKDSAIQYFTIAKEQFLLKEYQEAITNYYLATTIEPTWIELYLAMGDAYLELNDDSLANQYYKAALYLDTNRSATYYHLAGIQLKKGNYEKSLDRIMKALWIYPDKLYFHFLKDLSGKMNRDFVSQWIPRMCFPITTANYQTMYVEDENNPWYHYQGAKMKYVSYANATGILRPNEITPEKYLEVACFMDMLDSTKDEPRLKFAREMKALGYLDCYVLISLFHIDLYPQYMHLVKSNPTKVQAYYTMLLNWNKKKYDKVKEKAPTVDNSIKGKKKKK
jgi:hypothetical protein